MSVDMDIHGYPCIWISMDIHRKSVDMDMDMDVKFHIHGNPANFNGFRVLAALLHGTVVVGVIQTMRR